MGQILGPCNVCVWVAGGGGGGDRHSGVAIIITSAKCCVFLFVPSSTSTQYCLWFLCIRKIGFLLFFVIANCNFPGSWHILVVCNSFLHYSVEVILHMNTYFHICYSVERIVIWTHIINILYIFMKIEFLCFLFCTSWNLYHCFLRSASCVASQCLEQCSVCVFVWCALAFTSLQKFIFLQTVCTLTPKRNKVYLKIPIKILMTFFLCLQHWDVDGLVIFIFLYCDCMNQNLGCCLCIF